MVIKIEKYPHSFCNIIEFNSWIDVENTKYSKFFAPCRYISDNGKILIMDKTERLNHQSYPSRMPSFFSDFKYSNYGLLNGNFVCHDYGDILCKKMTLQTKKVEWYTIDY